MRAPNRFGVLLAILFMALWGGAFVIASHAKAMTGAGEPVIAVFPPWVSEAAAYAAVADAGAAPLRRLGVAHVWLAVPADRVAATRLASDALVLALPAADARSIGLCGPTLPPRSSGSRAADAVAMQML